MPEVTDALGRGIDPGIKEAVRLFNLAGLETVASCEGHPGRALPGAWIDFTLDSLDTLEFHADEFNSTSEGGLKIRVHVRPDSVRLTTMELAPGDITKYNIRLSPDRPTMEGGYPLTTYSKLSRNTLTQFARYMSRSIRR